MGKIMYYADVAEHYYNAACPSHAQNGYEKNVLLDTETEECIFVPGEVTPEEGELIFRCKRAKGITVTTLKTPKREKKENNKENRFNYPKISGIIRKEKDGYGSTNTYVSTPFEMPFDTVLTTKLSNMDEFMDVAMKRHSYMRQPFEALRELEMQVQEAHPGYLEEIISFTYRGDRTSKGEYIFKFSHFEKINDVHYCAVYDYVGSTYED